MRPLTPGHVRQRERSLPATPKEENAAIRKAVLTAVRAEGKRAAFELHGRGHEPRSTLSVQMAAILRDVEIPRAWISGYGANAHYPTRVFTTARRLLQKSLGWSPIEVYGESVYRISKPLKVKDDAKAVEPRGDQGTRVLVLTLPDRSRVRLDMRTFQFRAISGEHESGVLDSLSESDVAADAPRVPLSIDFVALARCFEAPSLPFSECFRLIGPERYSPRYSHHSFDVRFLTRLYKCPGRYQGGTFCPSLTDWDFLDGGITSQHGYGSVGSWTVVRGPEALRTICMFFGIKQPRRLKDQSVRRPLSGLLEDLSRLPLHEPHTDNLAKRLPTSS